MRLNSEGWADHEGLTPRLGFKGVWIMDTCLRGRTGRGRDQDDGRGAHLLPQTHREGGQL